MADVFKGLTIKLGADTTGLSKALKEVSSGARGAASELKQIEKAMKMNPSSSALGVRQIELLNKQVEAANDKLKVLKTAEEQLGKEDLSSEQWTKLQSEIAIAEANVKKYSDALNQAIIKNNAANSTLGKMGQKLQDWGKSASVVGQHMQSVGGALTRTLTPAIVAAGAASIAAAVDIDTSLTNVRKTVDGTEQQYQALKQAAIEFSKTNAVSATEILDIQSLGAQLGFAIEELDEFSRVVSGLDIATNMNAEQAATELAQFANITKMSHGEISNYGSAIVGLGNSFATTESDISSMAMRLAAAGTQVGMSQADILGLATALSSMGVEAEAGGTAVSTIMANIDKAVATNSESLSTWAQTANMSVDEFSNAWRNNAAEALGAVLSGMEQAVEEGGNMSLMLDDLGISSLRQTDVMKRLAGNSELVAQAVAKSNEEWTKNTALQAEVDNRNASLAAKFEMLKNRLTAIAEKVGGPLADALLDIVDAAEPLFNAIEQGAQAFADMSKEEQQTVLACAGVAAALGPLLSVFGRVLSAVEPAGRGLTALSQWLAKIAGAGAPAAAALEGVGEGAAQVASKGVKAGDVIKGLGSKFSAFLAGSGPLVLALTALVYALAQLGSAAIKAGENAQKFQTATQGLQDASSTIGSNALSAADGIDEMGESASKASYNFQNLIDKQAQLAQTISDRNKTAARDQNELERYGDTIKQLSGKIKPTEQEIAELKLAVEAVNEALGTDFSVERVGDSYQVMKDGAENAKQAILDLIAAQQLQIQIEADSANLKDLYEQKAENIEAVAAAQEKETEAYQRYLDSVGSAQEDAYWTEWQNAKRSLDEVTGALDSTQNAIDATAERQQFLKAATEQSADAYTKLVANNGEFTAMLAKNGQSCFEFTQMLRETGASVTDLSQLGSTEMIALSNAYDGSLSSIINKLDEFGISVSQSSRDAATSADELKNSLDLTAESVQNAFGEAGKTPEQFAATMQTSMEEAKLSVTDFQNLTSEQLAAVVQAYGTSTAQAVSLMTFFAEQNRQKGTEAGQAWYSGFSENTMLAAAAAAEMAGQTVQEFFDSIPETERASEEAVLAYIAGLKTGDGSGGEQLAQTEADAAANSSAMDGAGDGAVQTYEEPLKSASGEGGQQLAQAEADGASSNTEGYVSAAESGKEAYDSAIGQSDGSGGRELVNRNAEQAAGASGQFESAAQEGNNRYQAALGAADGSGGQQLADNALNAIKSKTGEFGTAGTDQGNAYCDGVRGADGNGAGSELAQAADSGARSVNGYDSGANFGQGFVNGIRAYIGAAIQAATEMVNAAKAAADAAANSHSPSREMYKRGMWFDQGMALGIEDYTDEPVKATKEMIKAALGSTKDDSWTFGTAGGISYTQGYVYALESTSGDIVAAVEAVEDDIEEETKEAEDEFQEYLDRMIAGYKDRASQIKTISSDLADYIWGTIKPNIMAEGWTKPTTGAVYDSMKAIEAAGYTLDSYTKKMEEMEDKKAEWDEKMSDSKVSDSTRQSYEKWFAEYEEWIELNDSLSASFEDLQEWQGLYNLKDFAITGINEAETYDLTLQRLNDRLGQVNFSKAFIEGIQGVEDYADGLAHLADLSDESIQELVDSYDDLARAQRLTEIDTRSLWVNSLQYTQDGVDNAVDKLLDYRETCLDIKETLFSDKGMNKAFAMAGMSVEDFALSLESADISMKDFVSSMEKFTSTVSDGFSQMTKYNQTSFEEWRENLKLNMAESQAYAQNVAKVMNSIPKSVDSEAFRKAIYEQGFSKWGKVMDDMAHMTSSEIVEAVKLYNKSVVEAQQSAIEQFKALNPGDEMILATVLGIKDGQDKLDDATTDASEHSVQILKKTYPDWKDTGQYLAEGIGAGIQSKADEIANTAAETVRRAIKAAKDAAGIASPSKVMRKEVGAMMGEGMGLGIADEFKYIAAQSQKLANIPLDQLKQSQSVSNVSNTSNVQFNVVNNYEVRNDYDIARITREQNNMYKMAEKAGGWV